MQHVRENPCNKLDQANTQLDLLKPCEDYNNIYDASYYSQILQYLKSLKETMISKYIVCHGFG